MRFPVAFLFLAACSSTAAVPQDSQIPDGPRPADGRADGGSPDVSTDAGSADAALDVTVPDALAPDARPADLGDPFPTGPTGCMGTQGALTLLGATGNVTVYSGCKGASSYLLVWGGSVGSLGQSSLSTIKAAHSSALLQIPGVFGHGISACCAPSTNGACLSIYVSANTSTVWDLARALDKELAGEPDCFGIVADVPGALQPRCQPGPDCLPLPICDSAKYFDPVCCTVPAYNPTAQRVPTLPAASPIFDLELPQTPGECSHDGECVLNGCGNHCVAYTAPTTVAICPCYPALKDSFCGCVAGKCVWYEQK